MATRSTLDLLPLLDVFMVVLFVFATIQEGELDSSEQQIDALEVAVLEAQMRAESEATRAAALAAQLEVEARAAERAGALELENREFRQACGPRRPGGPLCPAARAEARELAELSDVQQRMLGALAVFEIEISGEGDVATGEMRERCCYRIDPPDGEWTSCGEIPRSKVGREDWFDGGAGGLGEALRETREGGAIVLLRQSSKASYFAADDLARLLRARFPNHHVDKGAVSDALLCPLF